MKILINALGADVGGGANHLINFVQELNQMESKNEYWFLCREKFSHLDTKSRIKFILKPSAFGQNPFVRIFFDNFSLPKMIASGDFDVLVSLTNFGPIKTKVPHIIFQTNAIYFSSWYRKLITGKRKIETSFRAELTHRIMLNAAVVVTPSNSMRAMIQETFPDLKYSDFQTLYHGFTKPTHSEVLGAETQRALNIPQHKIVYPSLAALHKGISLVFETVRELQTVWSDQFKIFLTFSEREAIEAYDKKTLPPDWENLCKSIVFLGKLPHSQMSSLYEACDLMFYPSLCESFGFSMIEAIGIGLPIVASKTPINQEICQNSALYFPIDSPRIAAENIKSVLSDSKLRAELLFEGQARFNSFDWSWRRYCAEFERILCNSLS